MEIQMKLSHLVLGTTLGLAIIAAPAYAKDAPAQATKFTAAELNTLATIATIDASEILVSEVALNKKVNSDVKDLAKMMVEQHSGNLTQILTMAGDAHAKLPAGGEVAKLAADGKNDLMALGALQGADFDKAYASAMVTGHSSVIKLIDTKLIKTAKSEEVKKFLTDTRATVEEHLEHAKKVQEGLK